MDKVTTAFNVLIIPHTLTDLSPLKIRTRQDAQLRLLDIAVQVKLNFRQLSKRYHPDNQKTGDRNRFEAIKESYDLLQDLEIVGNPYYNKNTVGIGILGDNLQAISSSPWNFSL